MYGSSIVLTVGYKSYFSVVLESIVVVLEVVVVAGAVGVVAWAFQDSTSGEMVSAGDLRQLV
jgi:hypothetical protein